LIIIFPAKFSSFNSYPQQISILNYIKTL
jgi:hypothetical protein